MKTWKYTLIFLGMTMVLYLGGIKTGADPLFDALGFAFSTGIGFTEIGLSVSAFFDFFFSTTTGILATIAATATTVIAGLFTRAKPENLILLPLITSVLVIFVATMLGLIQYTISLGQGWVSSLIVLLITPLTFGYIISLGEFFRGTD